MLLAAHSLAERLTSARQSAEVFLHAPVAEQPRPQQTTATATLPATPPPDLTRSPTAFPPDFTPSPTLTPTPSASPFPTSPAPDEAPGGAIYNTGHLVVEDCVFEENQARGYRLGGGAIFSFEGTLRVVRSRFVRNLAYDRGGAIYNWRTTTDIVDSSFEDNTGVYLAGAIASRAATLHISGSTFSGSRAFHWMDLGGTIFNEIDVTADLQPIAARLFLSNSTISGNSSGIYNNGWLALRHVTLVDNGGSGLRHFAGWAGNGVSLGNSIVANNGGGNCLVDEPGMGQGIVDAGGNLQYPGDGCGTGVLAADPLLGPLADNGGLTRTRLPALGSPAIDAAETAGCLELPVAGLDQRGRARPVDGDGNAVAACDSGAVEVGSLATPTPGFTPLTPPPSATWSPTPTASSTPTASPWPTADLTLRATLTPSTTPTPPGSSTATLTPFIPLPLTPTGSPTLMDQPTQMPRPTADPAHSPELVILWIRGVASSRGCSQPPSFYYNGRIANRGTAHAGPFVVRREGDGAQWSVSGLAAGQEESLGPSVGLASGLWRIDADDVVVELDEDNNTFNSIQVPLSPEPTCTPTPTEATPGPSISPPPSPTLPGGRASPTPPQPGRRIKVYLPRVVKATVGTRSRFDLPATWRGIVDR